ncbi:MAG: UDP-galactopyranose mutase [Clostridiales bacterium]|nr:UDP-galactopyranose mutase [Clostridiales bacterium]
MKYDYLIVGAGLFGCVFAREMTDAGKKCLVIDRRDHIGGNVYCADIEGVCVHRYGAHIFHTADEEVWQYVQRFVTFNNYVNSPMARIGDEIYNMPFNMNTFSKLWGVKTPAEAMAKIAEQTAPYKDIEPQNLEEQALKLVGRDIYEKLVKAYTEKQWGRKCTELPAFIIRRLPLRFTYDNNYFTHPHQGIPVEGYNALAEKLLAGSDVKLGVDYRAFIAENPDVAEKTVYTGAIDEFFDYQLGHLQYRTVRFEDEVLDMDNWQGVAVVNYTSDTEAFTRIIEHKHFIVGHHPMPDRALATLGESKDSLSLVGQKPDLKCQGQNPDKTVISREYPTEWTPGMEPYYPVNDERNSALLAQYQELAKTRPDVIFGGRLGNYRYYDMDQVIRAALDAVKDSLSQS